MGSHTSHHDFVGVQVSCLSPRRFVEKKKEHVKVKLKSNYTNNTSIYTQRQIIALLSIQKGGLSDHV
jgi:hypothetical protein